MSRRIGVIMNGVTGRMGSCQHLERSLVAIRDDGGLALASGERLVPDPVLVGRDAERLRRLADAHGIERWTTDLRACLANADDELYFDAQLTGRRAEAVRAAIAAGKHVYCEKPSAPDLATACELVRVAEAAGVKNGVVQDKLFLPGIRKLKRLVDDGFFGRLLSVRGEFGYWVFDGESRRAQRPSWNYRKEDGGGIALDMLSHWRYLLEGLFGPIRSVTARLVTHLDERTDEDGRRYPVTADDTAYALFELEGGVLVSLHSSWVFRVYRDDLLTLQVDGTRGSAVAGLHSCRVQSAAATPTPVWNPDAPSDADYRSAWTEVPDERRAANAFRQQWELFLRHVVEDASFPWDLRQGAKGVQLAELAARSSRERRWLPIGDLPV
jgi:predicted dehydrogenase